MLGSTGTPLVAVVSGSVLFKQTPLGGNSVWLSGSDGNRYFYAHLGGFAGSSRSVSQGEVIGYIGATGNANGTAAPALRGAPRRRGRGQPVLRTSARRLLSVRPAPATRRASWPQAASMSVPRLRRTVALTPERLQPVAELGRPAAGGDPTVGQPGVGLSGIRLTWAGRAQAAAQGGQLDGVAVAVVDAVDHRPLEAQPPALGREVLGARRRARRRSDSAG